MDHQNLVRDIKTFLEESDASRQACRPLKEGVQIGFAFTEDSAAYHVVKEGKQLVVREGPASKPDWIATLTPTAAANLCALQDQDVGDLGVEIFKRMARGFVEPESDDRIHVKLHAGFFTIVRNGYLGILPLGGPKVTKWLAQNGLKNMGSFKRVFKKLRGTAE